MSAEPRQRPLRADAQRNRDRVLTAAREAFAEEGLGVPIDEIARRAGVGVGTIYRQFPTKETLIAGILAAGLDDLADDAARRVDDPDAGEAFLGFLRGTADRAATDMALANALAEAGYDVPAELAGCKERLMTTLGELLRRAQEAGAIRADVTTDDVAVLIATTCTATERYGAGSEIRRRVLDVVLDGLRAPAAPR
jgi:AcrR family transcriptional regulator